MFEYVHTVKSTRMYVTPLLIHPETVIIVVTEQGRRGTLRSPDFESANVKRYQEDGGEWNVKRKEEMKYTQ